MRIPTMLELRLTPREAAGRLRDQVLLGIAHRLPRRLAYWSLIDSGVRHMRRDEAVLGVRLMNVLDRAGKDLS